MATHVCAYGAAELRHVRQRYWMYGLLLSAFIHGGIISIVQRLQPAEVTGASVRIPPFVDVGVGFVHLNQVPGIQPATGARHRPDAIPVESGTPVAVPEVRVRIERSFPTQEELRQGAEPFAVGYPGEQTGVVVGPADDPEPPPFRAVEKLPEIVRRVTPAYMHNGPVSVWVAVPFWFRLGTKRD